MVRGLTVLYDARCGLCSRAAHWLDGQRQLVPLEMLSAGSAAARQRYPSLAATEPEELVVVSDSGDVYRGPQAWIMCLWALDEYRDWSFRFARPSMLPLARGIVEWISTRRHALSRALGMMSDDEIGLAVRSSSSCADGRCLPAPKASR